MARNASTAHISAHGVDPHLFVILGGTGDLTSRKLLPALAQLMTHGVLSDSRVLGASTSADLDDEGYRRWARDALARAGVADVSGWCDDCVYYQPLHDAGEAAYQALAERIKDIETKRDLSGNRIFYLALPPSAFPETIERLGAAGLNHGPGWTRLVIEKPFGRDLESAERLNAVVHRRFRESQVYRIDHYLGKETVQNLLVFRFANPIFEALWNRDRIASVHITVAESLGVGHRAGYYDKAGALRDMVQNHLTQLLTLTAMEAPPAFDADAVRAEKVKVLRSVLPIGDVDVVWGQYAAGDIDGQSVPAYRDEEGVSLNSTTPTYVALRIAVANWRWQGVPFCLRTGKRLKERVTRIVVSFREPPIMIFKAGDSGPVRPNALVITLQPDEGFDLQFEVKRPGEGVRVVSERLGFRYAGEFGALPDAYETLLRDVAAGDQTLFVHADEVEASWRLYTPVLEHAGAPHPYAAGSWGPAEAEKLVGPGGWPDPTA
jgi:glucose-6-phosphate 1-dehydrogenase